jgi:hypothetical protein
MSMRKKDGLYFLRSDRLASRLDGQKLGGKDYTARKRVSKITELSFDKRQNETVMACKLHSFRQYLCLFLFLLATPVSKDRIHDYGKAHVGPKITPVSVDVN